MGKIKIHEIAKEVGLTSKQIIEKANSLGIEVSSHLSSVSEEQANKIKSSIKSNKDKTEKSNGSEKTKKVKDEKKNETPVIIRREVIVSEEKKKVEEKPKVNRNDVGFVERKKNQDYNIVYRNKTTKPMTFSELFGIKDNKKEKDSSKRRTKTLFSVTKAAKTCPTKVYRRIIPSRTTELGKSLPVCGTIVHYPHPSNEYRFNRSDRHGS